MIGWFWVLKTGLITSFPGLTPLSNPKVKQSVDEIDNSLQVARLIYGPVSRGFSIFCITWICINIVAQGAAALISLTYTVDDGRDFKSTYLRNGQSRVSGLDCYIHLGNPSCPSQVTTDALAFVYGGNVPQTCGPYSDEQSIISSVENFPYYCRRNTTVAKTDPGQKSMNVPSFSAP
ncbi:hypothetical protein ABVK25_012030 [Lepraria finkii]|uniref:Uncharacterized protein n=1 Tax=Lepraria finkii TaxID=1340010 RepID=A0ABR4AKV8_9LECA